MYYVLFIFMVVVEGKRSMEGWNVWFGVLDLLFKSGEEEKYFIRFLIFLSINLFFFYKIGLIIVFSLWGLREN